MTNAPEGRYRPPARTAHRRSRVVYQRRPSPASRADRANAQCVPPFMQHPSDPRPDNREVEEEAHKDLPSGDGPPRPSTEPAGSKGSVRNPHTETDPGASEQ